MKRDFVRLGVFAFALIACTLLLVFFAAGASWRMPLQPAHRIALKGADFGVVSGAGAQDEDALNVGSVGDDDNAVQTIALDHVGAADFPTLRYTLAGFPRTLELSLIFRRADTPNDVHAVVLPRPEGGTRSYDLRTVPEWGGDILEIGFAEFPTTQIVPKGQGFHPFTLVRAELWSPSSHGAVSALLTDWFAHWSWSLRSVHALGRDIDTPRKFSLVVAAAIWSLSALLLGVLLLRWRGRALGVGAFACVALAWLLLDLNWQGGLYWKLGLTRDIYAGKSWPERARLVADAPLLEVAARVRDVMLEEPANTRLLIASDSPLEMLRLVYHLLPANVAPLSLAQQALLETDASGAHPHTLPVGSIVAYYDVANGSGFDPVHNVLPLMQTDYPAVALLETRGLKLYRIGAPP